MRAILFPGQGSQKQGMGKELFSQFPQLLAVADEILGYSVEQLCTESDEKKLAQTEFTQPALYVVNALAYFQWLQAGNEQADYAAGHSLGEYNALLAAEVFDFATGLRLVKKRGELMSRAVHGRMAAILGLTLAEVENFLQTEKLNCVDIANINAPTQIVISGLTVDVEESIRKLQNLGKARVVPLQVSGPLHSRYLQDIADEFRDCVQVVHFAEPKIPVLANVTARPHVPTSIADLLIQQIVKPVRWQEIMTSLLASGVQEFVELGPGQVLTNLLKRIRRATQSSPIQKTRNK